MASAVTVIGLGVRTGTKAKRAQSVVLRDPMVTALVAWACSGLQDEDRLFHSLMRAIGVSRRKSQQTSFTLTFTGRRTVLAQVLRAMQLQRAEHSLRSERQADGLLS